MKSLAELEDRWTIEDLLDANIALDLWDEIEMRAIAKADAEAKAAAARDRI